MHNSVHNLLLLFNQFTSETRQLPSLVHKGNLFVIVFCFGGFVVSLGAGPAPAEGGEHAGAALPPLSAPHRHPDVDLQQVHAPYSSASHWKIDFALTNAQWSLIIISLFRINPKFGTSGAMSAESKDPDGLEKSERGFRREIYSIKKTKQNVSD